MSKLQTFIGVLLAAVLQPVLADSLASMPPVGPGTFPVACTNVSQSFGPDITDDVRAQYWEGLNGHYIADVLSASQGAFLFKLTVPDDDGLYPNLARQEFPYAAIVCYPTNAANTRADYAADSAGTRVVPKMQRASDQPLWADAAAKYPLMLYSHGLGGSPLNEGYLETITRFASYGYVVAMPFHGDPRFADVRYDGLKDLANVLFGRGFNELVEMQAVRPLSLRVLLDALLAHPDFRDHLDPARIAGFGTSLGGESLLLFSGAQLTSRVIPSLRSRQVMQDARLAASVGYVPYFGQRLLPAFGDDQDGVRGLTMPFLAISGTADTTAPIDMTEQGVNHLGGSRYLVAIDGLPHKLRLQDLDDIVTWTLTFFDAHLNKQLPARVRLARMNEVQGGAPDSLRVDYTAPSASGQPLVTEFYNTGLHHYFMTADPAEVAAIAAGSAGPGWVQTGFQFSSGAGTATPVCRFYGNPALNAAGQRIGPNSHFYTLAGPECEFVKRDPGWVFEGTAFNAAEPVDQDCPADRVPVYRVYNNDFVHNNSNHRYTTSRQEYRSMMAQGWAGEQTLFCVPP